LGFLVRVHIVDTARHAYYDTLLVDGNGEVVARIAQELPRQLRSWPVIEHVGCDGLEGREISRIQDADGGHGRILV
jgi:hypothetical protein